MIFPLTMIHSISFVAGTTVHKQCYMSAWLQFLWCYLSLFRSRHDKASCTPENIKSMSYGPTSIADRICLQCDDGDYRMISFSRASTGRGVPSNSWTIRLTSSPDFGLRSMFIFSAALRSSGSA